MDFESILSQPSSRLTKSTRASLFTHPMCDFKVLLACQLTVALLHIAQDLCTASL